MSIENPLNAKRLAINLGYSRATVYAAKNAGYQFSHGMKTQPSHFLSWLGEHPTFRTYHFTSKKSMAKHQVSSLTI
ncbi:hypothetical protein OAG52_00745 [Verrucomicrobia bacterium]|jgi:hypothetical protein|nr:hypothetical protein [Verrucomicrobiota bacterium]